MISREILKELNIEWVSPSADGRRQGYFRRISENRSQPTYLQARHRLLFSELSYSGFGQKGIEVQQDGRALPIHAANLGRNLKGTGRPKPKPSLEEKLLRLLIMKR